MAYRALRTLLRAFSATSFFCFSSPSLWCSWLRWVYTTWSDARAFIDGRHPPSSISTEPPMINPSSFVPLHFRRSDGWEIVISTSSCSNLFLDVSREQWIRLLSPSLHGSSFPRYQVRLSRPDNPRYTAMAFVPHPAYAITWGFSTPSEYAVLLSNGLSDAMRTRLWGTIVDQWLGSPKDRGLPPDHVQLINPPVVVCYRRTWAIITTVTRTWRYHETLPYDEIVEPVVLLRAQTWPMLLKHVHQWVAGCC